MKGLEHLRRFERLRRKDAEQADATTLALRLYDHLVATGHAHDVIERTLFKWIAQQGLSGAQAHAIAQRAHIHLVAPQASGRPVVNLRARSELEHLPPTPPPARPWRPLERFDQLHSLAGRTRSEIAFSEVRHLEVMREANPEVSPSSPYRTPSLDGVRAPMPGVYALQMSARSDADSARTRALDLEPSAVLSTLGAGRPLPLAMRAELGPRLAKLGVVLDLSRIRIHDDEEASRLCTELGAEAFAVGHHVVLGAKLGHERSDLALLAHELTHVWQQSRGVVAPGVDGSSGLEAEARRIQHAVERGDGTDEHDPGRARETSRLVRSFGRELGLDPARVEVHVDDAAREETSERGLLGLMRDGEVHLDPDAYNPHAPSGRALLAHELVHVAQREQHLRGAHLETDAASAELEAHELASRAAMGQALTPPTLGLPAHAEAACGPQAMAERETPPARPPRRETEPPEPTPTTQTVRVPPVYRIERNQIVLPPIHYRVDKDEITETSPDARPIMRQLAETLKTWPEITRIRIEGFTSTTGSEEHNRALSQRRADKTRAWLLGKEKVIGVEMDTRGWGEAADRLKIKTADEVEEDANRRTEVTIVEVDGRPAPPNWQPTRMKLVAAGQTIIRHLDADGRVVREEVIPDGAETASNDQGPASQAPAAS